MNFTGRVMGETAIDLFIYTDYFNQPLGDTSIGEREIDAQTWSSTEYVGLTMGGDETVFGVNFVDGRIKGYPKYQPPVGTVPMTMYFRMVRGNTSYGINDFTDNEDGTITDIATGLMWQQADDGNTRDWENALSYAEDLNLAGYNDWRLPNAKELQSIVDYTRAPDITNSAAIDPIFFATTFNDPDGNPGQYGYYWTGSPHLDGVDPYTSAVYIAFGEAQGEMNGVLMDVHGAGSQRSDPKTGDPADYPQYSGPQGDVRYVFNYVRCVRDSNLLAINENTEINLNIYPNPAQDKILILSDYQIETISIYNVLGKKVLDYFPNQKESTVDINFLSNGVYFVNIISNNGGSISKKLIVKK